MQKHGYNKNIEEKKLKEKELYPMHVERRSQMRSVLVK